MGLTSKSTGLHAIDSGLHIQKTNTNEKVIALAGNPNVGKSTVFNSLTGMNQHTGNWPGKTVASAEGTYNYHGTTYHLVDIPGTYSLMAHSPEEEVARDFICFGDPDATIVVCDATCLERNLNLVLQTMEITENVLVCVNLMDEAQKKHIQLNLAQLCKKLGVPVVGITARTGKGLASMMEETEKLLTKNPTKKAVPIQYTKPIEDALALLEQPLREKLPDSKIHTRWIALRLLEGDEPLYNRITSELSVDLLSDPAICAAHASAQKLLKEQGLCGDTLKDQIVSCIVQSAEDVARDVVQTETGTSHGRDIKIDRILTNKWTGYPIMVALLACVFWLTITGANYPSKMLSDFLFWIEARLIDGAVWLGVPKFLYEMVILGMYRVLAWVVSVMLPPMAIFFPLFTLLEDLGVLPRIAFNLDKAFRKCCACGKQALTMCMGFGCNAAGIVGCRIIDSPRERIIAMITNSLVPCNGRFPTMIAIITMFFVGVVATPFQSLFSTLLLTLVVVLGIVMTFVVSGLLSKTFLKGQPSSFTLELPPYRRPQIGKIIVRSIFDRTLFVLGRAVVVAAPTGLLIWLLANVSVAGDTLLAHCAAALDPFGRLLGMDGVILLAFILGFPANEIVVPIIIMAYMANGSLIEFDNLQDLKTLLVANGWTWITAVSTMLFSLMHWPCSTTLLTIKKESQSVKWTALSVIIPTVLGMLICLIFSNIARLFL